ncbi:MAG: hypothetical protein GY714_01860 [Desulfobacterales bacterium]|nr:hypothetical protein [Desulfobacterales bacterium]
MKYLSDYIEEAQTKLFNDMGAFFAFSNSQLEEKREKDVIYVSCGAGLIAPKCNAKELMDGLNKIAEQGIEQDIKENGIKAIIERELNNHECYYTGDIEDCVDKLADYPITQQQIAEHFYGKQ